MQHNTKSPLAEHSVFNKINTKLNYDAITVFLNDNSYEKERFFSLLKSNVFTFENLIRKEGEQEIFSIYPPTASNLICYGDTIFNCLARVNSGYNSWMYEKAIKAKPAAFIISNIHNNIEIFVDDIDVENTNREYTKIIDIKCGADKHPIADKYITMHISYVERLLKRSRITEEINYSVFFNGHVTYSDFDNSGYSRISIKSTSEDTQQNAEEIDKLNSALTNQINISIKSHGCSVCAFFNKNKPFGINKDIVDTIKDFTSDSCTTLNI